MLPSFFLHVASYFPPHVDLKCSLHIPCRALPLFVVHRMNWDILYPHMDLEEEELQTLSSNTTYIAGFTDPAIEGRTDLYDLLVNGEQKRCDKHFLSKIHRLLNPDVHDIKSYQN